MFNFRFIEHRETRCGGFEREQRVKFSSVARRSRHEHEYGETRCETETSEPPSEIWLIIILLYCSYVEKVFDIVRQKLGRPEDDTMDQIDTNLAMWRIFMTTCTKAAVHLGKDYEENLRVVRNTNFWELRPFFTTAQCLILNQKEEAFGVNTVDWDKSPWMKRTLVHEYTVKLLTAEVYVFPESVLCLGGKCQPYSESCTSVGKNNWEIYGH